MGGRWIRLAIADESSADNRSTGQLLITLPLFEINYWRWPMYYAQDPRRWLALAVLLLAVAMDLIDTTVATLALPAIQADLGASDAALEWIVDGYALAFALGLITGRPAWRCLRAPPHIHSRTRRLHRLVGAVRAGAERGAARRVPRGPGRGRGADDPSGGLDQRRQLPRPGPPEGVRSVRRRRGPGHRRRATVQRGAAGGRRVRLAAIFLINVPLGLLAIAAARALVRESRPSARHDSTSPAPGLLTVALVLLLLPLVEGHQLAGRPGRSRRWSPRCPR